MFRDVPECFGMFHVPGFIDAPVEMANCLKATPPPTDRSAPRYLNTCLGFLHADF